MQKDKTKWVLGHKVTLLETDESYGLVEITSPPKVPGPPPHFHKDENEFFYIVQGTLEVMANGQWKSLSAGSFVDLPPRTVHTFINKTDEDVVWITGWRPKGFQKFFEDFGYSADSEGAREESVSEKTIQRVANECGNYGMFISK